MSDEQQLPPWARKKARPEGRPTWLVVLALAMLVFGGRLLIDGIAQLTGAAPQLSPELQVLRDSLAQAYRDHAVAVTVNGVSKLLTGLVMLFAVAAVFASDLRARKAAMGAAWVGIAYQIVDFVFVFRIIRWSLRC